LNDLQEIASAVKARDTRAVAQAISLVEERSAEGPELLKLLEGGARPPVIGVTGAPGVGKSTLVDGMLSHYRRAGRTVAVIAVDPSSPITGGAVLGDRVRMHRHYTDPGVFIRSMATRGAYGGLAPATRDAVTILAAAGYDLVLVETVGVGQSEVEVMHLADIVLLVLVPGMGDAIQTLKAGIMEIADIFVLNKSDHDGASSLEQQVKDFLRLSPGRERETPVLRTVAATGEGIRDLCDAVDQEWRREPCTSGK